MNWSDLLLMLSGLEREDVDAVGSYCAHPPDPRVLPFPRGAAYWSDRERAGLDSVRSTYRNEAA